VLPSIQDKPLIRILSGVAQLIVVFISSLIPKITLVKEYFLHPEFSTFSKSNHTNYIFMAVETGKV